MIRLYNEIMLNIITFIIERVDFARNKIMLRNIHAC